MKLTQKEIAVFEFIKKRLEEGFAPTVREICEEFGYKSTSTAHRRIQALTEAGFLEKGNNQNRAIRIAGEQCEFSIGNSYGRAADYCNTGYYRLYQLYSTKSYSDDVFALKVRGDSMINVGILNGDIVVVEKTTYAENVTLLWL